MRTESSSRIFVQEASRARLARWSPSRAWKTSALTLSRLTPRTWAISSCRRSSSSKRMSAARWSSGRRWMSPTRSCRSERRWTWRREPVGARQALEGVVAAGDVVTPRAQDAEAAVAGDRVEPRLQLDRLPAAPEAVEGRDEHLLEGVLGLLLVAEHVAAERQQLAGVPLVDDLEGRLVAGPDLGDEPGVTALVDGPLPKATAGRQVDRGGRHVVIMPPFTSTVLPLVRMSHRSSESPHAGRDPRASLPEASLPGCDDVPPGLLPLVVVAPDVAPCLPAGASFRRPCCGRSRAPVCRDAAGGRRLAERRRSPEMSSYGHRSRPSAQRRGPAQGLLEVRPMASPPRPADFPHHLAIPTRWADNDVYGHVNNVEYYAFFDTVINRWLIDEGGLDIHAGPVIGVCAESHCTLPRAASTFPEAVDAGLRVGQLGSSSVRYEIGLFGDGRRRSAAADGLVRPRLRRPRPRAARCPVPRAGSRRALERAGMRTARRRPARDRAARTPTPSRARSRSSTLELDRPGPGELLRPRPRGRPVPLRPLGHRRLAPAA